MDGRRAARTVAATLGGDGIAFTSYRERLLTDYVRYLWTRDSYYRDERRWPDSPFWERRHGRGRTLTAHGLDRAGGSDDLGATRVAMADHYH
jgi:hypothetical protein